MGRTRGKGRRAAGSFIVLALLSACCPSQPARLDAEELALLRLEYLERAEKLPSLKIESIRLPFEARIGRFSAVLWRIRSDQAPGREFYRPLPVDDVELRLYRNLEQTLGDFGFNVQSGSEPPELRLRVEVERLVLESEDGANARRACELSLIFHVEENPSGLAIKAFSSKTSLELPGSWTSLNGEVAIWTPEDPAADPISLAARAAAESFLKESLDFWKKPSNWDEGGIKLSSAKRP